MRAVEVDGVTVELSRSESGEVCAIADICTHMALRSPRASARATW
jgi:nitrite reductase/ring-hydroxylating ferredoxin subunit